MATFEMSGIEEIKAERLDNEWGDLRLTIKGEDSTQVVIDCGRFFDDAEVLKSLLFDASQDVANNILNGWEDRPDGEADGFVFSADRQPGYVVQLSGSPWDGEVLGAHNARSNARPVTFPTRDAAEYELAAAMSESGYFPNVWYENDRGITDDIGESVRKYHDEGGTGLLPLPGVKFEPDSDVWTPDGYRAVVVKDYGAIGITYVLDGDGERRHEDTNEGFTPYEEDEDES
jgi:hypothetical protein